MAKKKKSEEYNDSVRQPLNYAQQDVRPVIVATSNGKAAEVDGEKSDAPPDGGWRAWLVCAASFYANGAMFGVINSGGVLYTELNKMYGAQDDASFRISLVTSLAIGTTFLLSPVASILTDRFGIQKTALVGSVMVILGMFLSSVVNSLELLYLTYGFLFGTGASLAYTPSLVILGHYFKRNLGIVNGIVTAGSSLFTIVLPLLLRVTLKTWGLSTTYHILTAWMVPLLACAFIFKPLHKPWRESVEAPNGLKSRERYRNCCSQTINTSIWRNRKYMVWALVFPASLLGYFVPYTHLVKHVDDILPESNGELLITCIGLASGVGRIIFGKIADVPNVNRIFLQQLAFFFLGVLTMLLAAANAYWNLVVLCLGLGLSDGCFITLLGPIAFDIVGMKGASQAIGFLLGICSLPLTFGPPIAGWMYDHLGKNYQTAFLAAGVPSILGSLLMFIIAKVKQPEETSSHECDTILKSSVTQETTLTWNSEQDEVDPNLKLKPGMHECNGFPVFGNSLNDQQNQKSENPVMTPSENCVEKKESSEIIVEKEATC